MNPIFYYDGKFYKPGEAAVPLTDRSLFFGDAIYDACLVKKGRPYLLDAHLDRFYRGYRALQIKPKMEKEKLRTLFCELCEKAGGEISFLYFQAARSAPKRRHFSDEGDTSHLLVTVTEGTVPQKDKALRLILTQDHRYDFCHIKTVNLLPAVLASTKAKAAGADEAVFVRGDTVTECAHSNISILKNGTLFTHPKSRRILPGTQREQLIRACRMLNIPVEEIPFSVKALFEADEIFVTSSSRLCQRASLVNGKAVGYKDEKLASYIMDDIFWDFWNM